jgi:hypothetical protein
MGDVLASKGELNRTILPCGIKAEVRRWLRRFRVAKNELKRAVEKVSNSVVAPETNGHRLQWEPL